MPSLDESDAELAEQSLSPEDMFSLEILIDDLMLILTRLKERNKLICAV